MELVAGSYEQVLFGFTVRRGPARSGQQEVRQREPGAAGAERAGPSRAEPWRLLFMAGSPRVENEQAYADNPVLERLRQEDSELKACVERSCSLQTRGFSE